jgi:hypothetical protein
MKIHLQIKHIIGTCLLLCLILIDSQSGVYAWTTPAANITADRRHDQRDWHIGATVYGTTGEIVILAGASVFDFKAEGSSDAQIGLGFRVPRAWTKCPFYSAPALTACSIVWFIHNPMWLVGRLEIGSGAEQPHSVSDQFDVVHPEL